MACPSVKTLAAAFGVEKARAIRAVFDDSSSCNVLERIDVILGTHGVEYIPQGHNQRSPSIEYCNTGDPYITTVMRVGGVYRVGCWGDIVERGNYD